MVDSLYGKQALARTVAGELIVSRRDALIAERTTLVEQRSEILARLRRIDREIADCRAAARFFSFDIEFPSEEDDERRELVLRRELLQRERDREREEAMRATRAAVEAVAARHATATGGPPASLLEPPKPEATQPPNSSPSRPPLRDVLLDQLKIAGAAGSKAAPLRDYYERTFGIIIHEKTVGMTLYRLSKDGLVHRDGHTWFFGPATAETENPGAATPGSDNEIY